MSACRQTLLTAQSHDRSVSCFDTLDRTHALCTGGYVIAVFSGSRRVLEELAGEATALIPHKAVVPDPMLGKHDDLAYAARHTLPSWPLDEVRPIDGVCFVFSNPRHPFIGALEQQGGVRGEHFIITDGRAHECEGEDVQNQLLSLLHTLPGDSRFAIVGFGHQGQRLTRWLMHHAGIDAKRLVVWDTNPESAELARTWGIRSTADESSVLECDAIIATPKARYERITQILERARSLQRTVIDQAHQGSGRTMWRTEGRLMLDDAARRAFLVESETRLVVRDRCLEPLLRAVNVREDRLCLAGQVMPQLCSGQHHAFAHAPSVDCSARWLGDGLTPQTWQGMTRAYVSTINRPAIAMFAARDFCKHHWPAAVSSILPSEHWIDLGATAFERLLLAHHDGREVVSTMQTPLQRVVLGIVARHYSADRPIVEIGSALGGSALHMAAATCQHRPQIVSIDPDVSTRDIMRFALGREGHVNRLIQIVKPSEQAIAELGALAGSCGLVFIDGLHTVDAVRRDFLQYAALVAIGGAMAFHDVCPALHSVMQAIVESVLPDDRFIARALVDGLLIIERVA